MTDKPTEPTDLTDFEKEVVAREPTTTAGRRHLMQHFGGHVGVYEQEWADYAAEIKEIERQARQQSERDVLALRRQLIENRTFIVGGGASCWCPTDPPDNTHTELCRENSRVLTDTAPAAQAIEDGIRAPLLARIAELTKLGWLLRGAAQDNLTQEGLNESQRILSALSTPDPSPVACWHDAMDIQCDCPSPSTDAVAEGEK